ncbi:hypothetical protein C9374_007869 [Naegleria lovaniensis]|uniref:Uncharacterized protein n=1 Tax=Naegleria lovaniensis TaxID=51637 RepID=A0AA88GK79_NAELO|nr:uncharacterized protein C9374_007869 [Naegleria lovaniensis]KAG2378721.1 hypothetical protein C9374_007869 [Naegleria lovaniensis]
MYNNQAPHSSSPNVVNSMNRSSSSPQMSLNHPYLQRVQQGSSYSSQRGRMSPQQMQHPVADHQVFSSPPIHHRQSPILNSQANSNQQGMTQQVLQHHHQSLNMKSQTASATLRFLNEESADDLYSFHDPHSETLHSPRSQANQNVVPSSSSVNSAQHSNPNTGMMTHHAERMNQSQISSKVRHIPRQDPFFHHLEYSVKLAIGAVSCSVSRVYCLRDATEYNQFKQYQQLSMNSSGGFLDVWLNLNDSSHMGSNNTLESIISEGFQIPENGMRVSIGRINLDPNTQQMHTSLIANQNLSRGSTNTIQQQQYMLQMQQQESFLGQPTSRPRVYRLLHCLLNTGRSFCLNRDFNEEVITIPQGYDSVYIQPNEANPNYSHEFIIFDARQIFADCVLFVEHDQAGDEKMLNQVMYNDMLRNSDKIISKAYKKASDYVDQSCNPPSDEKLLLPEIAKQIQQRQLVMLEFENIEKRRLELLANAGQMESHIRELFRKSISSLHDITQLKLSTLLTREAELRRKMEEIEWMNTFIEYQRTLESPLQFLESTALHKRKIKERQDSIDHYLLQGKNVYDTLTVPDITVEGKMEVVSQTVSLNGMAFKTILNSYLHQNHDVTASGNMTMNENASSIFKP